MFWKDHVFFVCFVYSWGNPVKYRPSKGEVLQYTGLYLDPPEVSSFYRFVKKDLELETPSICIIPHEAYSQYT